MLEPVFEWSGWNAIQTIGSIAAVLYAIRVGSQAARDARRREAVFIKNVIVPIEAFAGAIDDHLKQLQDREKFDAAWGLNWSSTYRRYLDILRAIDMTSAPSTSTIDALMGSIGVAGVLVEIFGEAKLDEDFDPDACQEMLIRRRAMITERLDRLAQEAHHLGGDVSRFDVASVRKLIHRAQVRR